MSVVEVADVDHSRPSVNLLVERARSMQPLLRERARETELNGRVSAEVMDKLAAAGLLQLVKPARFGGFEYGPSALMKVGFELGRACGSTAWCAMVSNGHALSASYWPIEAQEDVWGVRPEALLAGAAMPTGQCEAVEGGFNVWGRWPFASNCDNAEWTYISAMLPDSENGPGGFGWFLTPISGLEIDHESWQVSGLQGTGSKTLVAKEPVFVPAHRVIRFSDIQAGTTPGASIPGNLMAKFGFLTFAAAALAPALLGMAQGALDRFADAMRAKRRGPPRPGAPPMTAADNPFIQERAGHASAAIDSAMALILADLKDAEATIAAGGILDVEHRIRIRRDFGFGARQAVDAVDMLFEAAGASATDIGSPIQRHWRDIHAGAHHITFDLQGINTMVGQQIFGMTPVGMF